MISNSIQETKDIAKKFAATLQGGDVVLLSGELGAGKTAFTKGLTEYFGIEKEITSPTFSLMNIYKIVIPAKAGIQSQNNTSETLDPRFHGDDSKANFVHIDTYRLKNEQELIDIGVEDYLGAPDTICVIEWPNKIEKLLKDKKIITVVIEHVSENSRHIVIANEVKQSQN